MAKETDMEVVDMKPAADSEEAADLVEMKVVFSKPYNFEGVDYKEVDLQGMENLTAEDMCQADKYLGKTGNFSVMPEMTLAYALQIATKATGLPIEFFNGLPMRDAIKVKNRVTGFIYSGD